MLISYPAIFYKAIEGGYFVKFLDFDGGTQGDSIDEAMTMASDLLGLKLYDYFIKGENYPEKSNIINNIPDNEYAVFSDSFLSLVSVDMKEYVKSCEVKTVRKNVTIPSYLNEMAKNMNVNVSQILQEALKKEFEIE